MGSATSPARRTEPQNRQIWGLVSKIRKAGGLDEETADLVVRGACRAASGQEHTSQLTIPQAGRVIDHLQRELAKYNAPAASPPPEQHAPSRRHEPWGPRGGARADEPITPRQQAIVTGLFGLLGWDRARMTGFSRRQTGRLWPQTQAEADKLIEPLKQMVMRQVTPVALWERAKAVRGNVALNAFLRSQISTMCTEAERADAAHRLDQVFNPTRLLYILEAEAVASRAAERAP